MKTILTNTRINLLLFALLAVGGMCNAYAAEVESGLPKLTITFYDRVNSTCEMNNGEVSVKVEGGSGNYQYSLDNNTSWKTTNRFTGLAPYGHTMYVKDVTTGDVEKEDFSVTTSGTISIDDLSSTTGQVGVQHCETVKVSPAIREPGVTYEIIGTLPSWITFNATTKQLCWRPTQDNISHTFAIKATYANGCTDTKTITVTVGSAPPGDKCELAISSIVLPAMKQGVAYSAQLSSVKALGAVVYSHSGSLPSGVAISPSGNVTGTSSDAIGVYKTDVTAQDQHNLCDTTQTVYLLLTDSDGYVDQKETCATAPFNFAAPSGLPSGATYAWTSTPAGFTAATPSVNVTPTATTTYKLVSSFNGGSIESLYKVTFNGPVFDFAAVVEQAADKDNRKITITVSPSTYTSYKVSINGTDYGPFTSSPIIVNNVPKANTFEIKVTVEENSCEGNKTKTVDDINTTCNLNISNNALLPVAKVGKTYSEQLNTTGAQGTVTYTYTGSFANGITASAAGKITGTPSGSPGTVYVVNVKVEDGQTFCDTTKNLYMLLTDADGFIKKEETCAGANQSFQFAVPTGFPATTTYQWSSTPAGFTSTAQTVTVSPTASTQYTVNITYNGSSIQALYDVSVAEVEFDFSAAVEADANDANKKKVIIHVTPSTFASYQVKVNGVDYGPYAGSPIHVLDVPKASSYEVELTVTDANGCEDSKEKKVMEGYDNFPTVFTPNGDGVNDLFLPGFNLQVFNRSSQLLYEGTDGWDGKYKGKEQPEGVYFYTVKITGSDGKEQLIKKSVVLVRNKK